MSKITLLKASFAFVIQFWLPFLGGGYLMLREYKKALFTALAFLFMMGTPQAQWPYIWGSNWVVQTFGVMYFIVWYGSALHVMLIGVRKNSKTTPLLNKFTHLEGVC